MEFLKNKFRSWLGVDDTDSNVEELKTLLDAKGAQVDSVDVRLRGLCDVLHIGVDVAANPRDMSWAVLAVRGKQDQVYFYDLSGADAQAVHQFLERLPKNRCVVDAPKYLPIKRIFKF